MPSGTKTIKIHDDDNEEDAPSLPSLQRLSGGKVLPKDKDGDGGRGGQEGGEEGESLIAKPSEQRGYYPQMMSAPRRGLKIGNNEQY